MEHSIMEHPGRTVGWKRIHLNGAGQIERHENPAWGNNDKGRVFAAVLRAKVETEEVEG